MSRALIVCQGGPGVTVQDQGRAGFLYQGHSPGGAADMLALAEGAALLGQQSTKAAIELAGMGGIFQARGTLSVALTGAAMPASIEGDKIEWNASHTLYDGQRLTLGAARRGNYGYLHVGGGIATPPFLGSRATHLVAHIGAPLANNTTLPVGDDTGAETGQTLDVVNRFDGGIVRILASVQTNRFAPAELERLQSTTFSRDARGNRMGARMVFDGAPFAAEGQLSLLSEMVVPGDIQVTGDGTPFVLLGECQTTGGYPRIGTVIPSDIPRIAQARAGDPIRFQFVTRDQALAAYRATHDYLKGLARMIRPLIRSPHDIPDLLSYQLVGGMITGKEEDLQ